MILDEPPDAPANSICKSFNAGHRYRICFLHDPAADRDTNLLNSLIREVHTIPGDPRGLLVAPRFLLRL